MDKSDKVASLVITSLMFIYSGALYASVVVPYITIHHALFFSYITIGIYYYVFIFENRSLSECFDWIGSRINAYRPSSKQIILSILTGVIVLMTSEVVLTSVSVFSSTETQSILTPGDWVGIVNYIIYFVYMYVVIGLIEEYIFRHLIQVELFKHISSRTNLSFPYPIRIMFASTIFGVAHYTEGYTHAVVLSIVISSTLFGYLYEKTDNLATVIIAHGTYNNVIFTLPLIYQFL